MRSRLPLDVADLARTVAAIARSRPDAPVNALLYGAYGELSGEAARAGVDEPGSLAGREERPTYGELAGALASLSAACTAKAARQASRHPA